MVPGGYLLKLIRVQSGEVLAFFSIMWKDFFDCSETVRDEDIIFASVYL